MRVPFNQNILLLLLFIAMLLSSCAQIVAPTGGEKDVVGPKMARSTPLNFSTQYKDDKIVIVFDEFIRQNNISSQIIISPPLEEKPDIKVKKKTLGITFKEKLKDSTTYTINFGEGITDITENNPIDSPLFVFSTGTFLDSLSINGKVKNSFSLKPEKDVFVLLYDDLAKEAFRKKKPTYFAKVKQDGSFTLNYIKEGSYNIYALKDANNNYQFDLPNEWIAFMDDTIQPATIKDSLSLYLFEEENPKQYIKQSKLDNSYAGYKCTFVFNLPVKEIAVDPINSSLTSKQFIKEASQKGDTIIYWITDTINTDLLELQIKFDTTAADTVELLVPKEEKTRRNKQDDTPPTITFKTNLSKSKPLDLNKDIVIKFAHPLTTYELNNILLTENEDTLDYQASFTDDIKRTLHIKYNWKEETNYQLYIPPKTFTDIFGLKNDTIKTPFFTPTINSYGTLKLKINLTEGIPYLLQLMSSNEQVIVEKNIKGSEELFFEYMQPMPYKIKLIYDTNNDKQWNTGNYSENKQPEKVIYYPEIITIRSNWDLEIEWIVE